MQTACYWQLLFSDRFTGARNPARLPTTDAIPSNPLRPLSTSVYHRSLGAPIGRTTSRRPDRPRCPRRVHQQRRRLTPLFHVVLLDDDEHTYDYVVEMLDQDFLPLGRSRVTSRGRSRHHRPHHRHHLRARAGRIRPRSDSRLWRRSAHAGLERLDERDYRARQRLICTGRMLFRTLNGAQVGDLFMSLIHTCQLRGANSFDYLTELQGHAQELAANPAEWMPWNYCETLQRAGV